jgi:hypothetical protein
VEKMMLPIDRKRHVYYSWYGNTSAIVISGHGRLHGFAPLWFIWYF